MIIFKRYFISVCFIFITSLCYAEDKGWNILYDRATGEIVEMSYGDSGYQHRIDEGYSHIKIQSKDADIDELKDYKVKNNKIIKKPQSEIDTRKLIKEQKEKQRKAVDLEIKKDMAKKKGYTELEAEYQTEIDKLQ